MYSRVIKNFESTDIILLRSIDDMCKYYDGVGICDEFIDESNIEIGEVCQLSRTPSCYHVGFFNKRGSGKSYYTVVGKRKFIEGIDFNFY